jgi:hypothetical protein|tara:strand:+ start:1019 stop:1168 length:150 start_codon:yes stop_codon:yes gene_type:complete
MLIPLGFPKKNIQIETNYSQSGLYIFNKKALNFSLDFLKRKNKFLNRKK